MVPSAKRIQVGAPPYLVARPLAGGLEGAGGLKLVRGVPAKLVEGLRDGSLDVALVSSIELFRRPGYAWLDGPAVATRGGVASVQVFLRRPLEDLRSVALDPSSRAAQALARIVLPGRVGGEVRFFELPQDGDPAQAAAALGADAWLEIGDPALRRFLSGHAPPSFDPAAAWTQDTALPFVFALWVVRPGVALTEGVLRSFAEAWARGAEGLEALAAEAAGAWSLPLAACRRYLREECRFQPGAELGPALFAFRDAAARLGLCLADAEPQRIALPRAACRPA